MDESSNHDDEAIQMTENYDHLRDDDDEQEQTLFSDRTATTNVPRVTCALLASITTGGVSYAFGMYGSALKKNLHLTQSQLETISSATFCAGLFSWIPGMFVDRFGTRTGITMGGITGATSLMLYWGVAHQYIPISETSLIVTVLSALSMAIFLSCALITGAVFKIISCACGSTTRGSAVGVAKGYVGLGSGAYACLFQSLRTSATSDLDFLPMCAFFFICMASIPSFINLPTKEDEKKKIPDSLTPFHFRILFGSLLVLALLIIGNSVMELFHVGTGPQEEKHPNYPLAFTIFLVWLSPLAAQVFLPKNTGFEEIGLVEEEEQDALLRSAEPSLLDDTQQDSAQPTDQGSSQVRNDAVAAGSNSSQQDNVANAHVQMSLYEMLRTYPAWLMAWTATILVGGGIVETNNLGQMVESLHFPPVVTPASLSLFSVAQSGGRVLTGALSDWGLTTNTKHCLVDRGIPRPFFLVAGSAVAVLSHTILAVSNDQFSFVCGIALSGLAFGSVWPLMVLVIGEIYGTANVGANYMFYDGFASAAGAFVLNKVVAQEVYERHVDPHYSDGDDGATCYGQQCFQMTHVIIAFLSVTCIGTSLAFQWATRERYNCQ